VECELFASLPARGFNSSFLFQEVRIQEKLVSGLCSLTCCAPFVRTATLLTAMRFLASGSRPWKLGRILGPRRPCIMRGPAKPVRSTDVHRPTRRNSVVFTECSVRAVERKGLIGEASGCGSQHDVFNILSHNCDINAVLPLRFTSTRFIPLDINEITLNFTERH
jgi:hypothetical protein